MIDFVSLKFVVLSKLMLAKVSGLLKKVVVPHIVDEN